MRRIFLIIFIYCLTVKCAPDISKRDDILTFENHPYNGVDGGYSFEYETRDRQSRKEEGKLVTTDDNQIVLRVTGYYSFIDPEGEEHLIEYEADENGYRQNERIVQLPVKRISQNAIKSLVG